jgi:RND family efflux transporter MFP subunit
MSRFWFVPLLTLGVAGCGAPAETPEAGPAPVAVTTSAAGAHLMRQSFEAGGVIAARTTATVASRIVATVLSVDVAPGDRVRAGQRLIVLDARDLDAQRRQTAASVTALEQSAAAAVADQDAAGAALTLAQATHERMATLHARRSATPQELDEATSALRGAEARLRAAEARAAEMAAAIESARAAASAASVTASFAELTAPFDGIVTEKLVEPGNLAAVGVPLLRVEDTRGFRLEARLDESRAGSVEVGAPVAVRLGTSDASGVEAAVVNGQVAEIARSVDAASHAFLIKIDLPPDPRLRSGMFARARFEGGEPRQALTVPAAAIVPQGQLSTVFVVTGQDVARMRVLRTGESADGRVEVIAGLAPDETVIVAPPPGLRDGDPVRAAGAATPNAQRPAPTLPDGGR